MEFSVHRPSPPNTYSYVREEKSGSTRKFVQNYLLFRCISNLGNSCNTRAEHEWAQGTILRQRRKVPPAHAQQVYDSSAAFFSLWGVITCSRWAISRSFFVVPKAMKSYEDALISTVINSTFVPLTSAIGVNGPSF